MTRDRKIIENQGMPEYAKSVDLPSPLGMKGLAIVQDPFTLYAFDGVNSNKITYNKFNANDYENIVPTHYFDPSALGSSGTGTYTNPFTTQTQLAAYLASIRSGGKANLSGKVLGLKRGTTINEEITLSDIYGSNSNPFLIVPYGDDLRRPIITGLIVSTGWERYSSDGRIWKKVNQYNQQFWDSSDILDNTEYHRYWMKSAASEAAAISALQSAGNGYAAWYNGYSYIFPFAGSNPNNGKLLQTNQQSSVSSSNNSVLNVAYSSLSSTGNIHVYGLQVHGGRNSAISISKYAAGSSAVNGLIVADCYAGYAGIDGTSAGGSDAITIFGESDSVRATNCIVSNNYMYDANNNAVEIGAMTNAIIERNESIRIGGNVIAELWYSCSGTRIQYNIGSGVYNETRKSGVITFSNKGVWIPGYSLSDGSQGSLSQASSVNNSIAFNYIDNVGSGAISMFTGQANILNNVIVNHVSLTAPNYYDNVLQISAYATGDVYSDITLSNNIIVNKNYYNGHTVYSVNAGDIIRGNNNIFWNSNGAAQRSLFRGTTYNSLATWIAQVDAVTSGSQSASVDLNPLLNVQNVLPGSYAKNNGTTITGYTVDLNGATITNNFIGANK